MLSWLIEKWCGNKEIRAYSNQKSWQGLNLGCLGFHGSPVICIPQNSLQNIRQIRFRFFQSICIGQTHLSPYFHTLFESGERNWLKLLCGNPKVKGSNPSGSNSHSWDLLEIAKKNLVFHFGVGRQASFPLRWSVKNHWTQLHAERYVPLGTLVYRLIGKSKIWEASMNVF